MAAVAPQAAPPVQDSIFNFKSLAQGAAIYFAITFAVPKLLGTTPATSSSPATSTSPTTTDGTNLNEELNSSGVNSLNIENVTSPIASISPLWPAGSILDILIAITTDEESAFQSTFPTSRSILWKGINSTDSSWSKNWNTELKVPTSVQQNGSLYADVFVTLTGTSPNPNSEGFSEESRLHVRKSLTRFLPERKVRVVSNLMSKKKEKTVEELEEEERKKNEILPIISYYHPNLTLELIHTQSPIAYSQLPPNLQHKITLSTKNSSLHYPVLYSNDFWLLNEHMNPLNSTTLTIPLNIQLSPVGFWKFQILQTLDDAFNSQADSGMGGGRAELDIVKRTLIETSPWLLITTFLVSILHMLFEFLAFTSDISHWKSKKELVGVSVRTIIANCVVQLVVLLYLYDNNENTSWMILGGQAIGLVIEMWKITKAVDIKILPSTNSIIPYKVIFADKHVLTPDEIKTQEFDKLAFKYVVWGASPFVVGYTIYAAIYLEHRSWYSFLLTTATSMVYLGGFIQLIPQLIINYKLRSVAHIPMKAFIFKFLSTIIDDLGALIIKQPLLHRLAAFRDDVVFLILLYQMWIYKVDHNRINEYGQVSDAKDKVVEGDETKALESKKEDEKLESKKDR